VRDEGDKKKLHTHTHIFPDSNYRMRKRAKESEIMGMCNERARQMNITFHTRTHDKFKRNKMRRCFNVCKFLSGE
jgi:hypothetical protein